MKFPLSYRLTNALLLLAPAGLLAYGYYLQFYEGQEPCPLVYDPAYLLLSDRHFRFTGCF